MSLLLVAVGPAPGKLNTTVDPIPTAVVPSPTVSDGSKYICLLFLKLYFDLNPDLNFSLLESSITSRPVVWATAIVPSCALKILILENSVSTFRTFTLSVPIPRISFSLIEARGPVRDTKVTNPVIAESFRAMEVLPNPTVLSLALEIPASYEPSSPEEVVERPETLIISLCANPVGFAARAMYSPSVDDG